MTNAQMRRCIVYLLFAGFSKPKHALSYCRKGAVVSVITWEKSRILDEHRHSFQDKCDEELDVNKVPGTTQPPVEKIK